MPRNGRVSVRSSLKSGAFLRLGAGLLTVLSVLAGADEARALDRVRATYLMRCGGCHGVEGVSGPTFVPELRDHVGTYLCSPEGRAYIVQVPNVSMSLIRDDALLAQVMNFVVFDLGGASTPAGAKPYTAQEVHELRQHPLHPTEFERARAGVLERTLAACAAKNAGH
nr:cystathionine beta-lyase [Ameyamaea chiangmaiensis]